MGETVSFEITFSFEQFVTVFALDHVFIHVLVLHIHVHMVDLVYGQGPTLTEALTANFAFKRFLSWMNEPVIPEMVLSAEGLVANVTGERTFVRVGPDVNEQVVRLGEVTLAILAAKFPGYCLFKFTISSFNWCSMNMFAFHFRCCRWFNKLIEFNLTNICLWSTRPTTVPAGRVRYFHTDCPYVLTSVRHKTSKSSDSHCRPSLWAGRVDHWLLLSCFFCFHGTNSLIQCN